MAGSGAVGDGSIGRPRLAEVQRPVGKFSTGQQDYVSGSKRLAAQQVRVINTGGDCDVLGPRSRQDKRTFGPGHVGHDMLPDPQSPAVQESCCRIHRQFHCAAGDRFAGSGWLSARGRLADTGSA